jgi:predicted nucleic-acid-binding protein
VDTNIFIRYFVPDHPEHSPLARQLFEQIERGEVSVRITDTVVFETVFTLEKYYRVPRVKIAEVWLDVLTLPGLVASNKEILRDTFGLWVERSALSYADSFHLISAKAMGLDTMITFDRKMSIPGVTRVEPPLA